MEYNRQQKMKKVLFSMAMIAMIAAGTLMLSAFNTPKQEENTDCSQIAMNDDEWTINSDRKRGRILCSSRLVPHSETP